VVPESGHNIHHDQPQLVVDAVRFWFGDSGGGGDLPEGLREATLDLTVVDRDD
jgi:hypothetical protein